MLTFFYVIWCVTGTPSSANRNSNKAIVAGAVTVTVIVVGVTMIAVIICVIRKHPTSYVRLQKKVAMSTDESAAQQQQSAAAGGMCAPFRELVIYAKT